MPQLDPAGQFGRIALLLYDEPQAIAPTVKLIIGGQRPNRQVERLVAPGTDLDRKPIVMGRRRSRSPISPLLPALVPEESAPRFHRLIGVGDLVPEFLLGPPGLATLVVMLVDQPVSLIFGQV